MAKPIFVRSRATADRLLTNYGESMEIVNASQTVLGTVTGILGTVQEDNTPSSIVETADTMATVTVGSYKPDVDDFLRYNGTLWKIIYVREVRPTDLTILYQLYLTR